MSQWCCTGSNHGGSGSAVCVSPCFYSSASYTGFGANGNCSFDSAGSPINLDYQSGRWGK
jgi:hypothetical protein